MSGISIYESLGVLQCYLLCLTRNELLVENNLYDVCEVGPTGYFVGWLLFISEYSLF